MRLTSRTTLQPGTIRHPEFRLHNDPQILSVFLGAMHEELTIGATLRDEGRSSLGTSAQSGCQGVVVSDIVTLAGRVDCSRVPSRDSNGFVASPLWCGQFTDDQALDQLRYKFCLELFSNFGLRGFLYRLHVSVVCLLRWGFLCGAPDKEQFVDLELCSGRDQDLLQPLP